MGVNKTGDYGFALGIYYGRVFTNQFFDLRVCSHSDEFAVCNTKRFGPPIPIIDGNNISTYYCQIGIEFFGPNLREKY
jgi:hypothetical protein